MEANQQPQAPQTPPPLTGPEAVAQWRQARAENQQPQDSVVEQAPEVEEPAVEDTIVEEPDEENQSQDETATDTPNQDDGDSPEVEDEGEDTEYLSADSIEDIETVAEALGIDVDELLDKLTVETTVAQQKSRMTLSEMRAEAQKNKDYERRKAEVQEERTQLREARKTQDEQWQKNLAYMGHVLSEYDQVNSALSEDYLDAVRSQLGDDAYREMRKVQRNLKAAQDKALNNYHQQLRTAEGENQQRMKEAIDTTIRETVNLMPDMADNAKARKVFDDVRVYLVDQAGFSPQDVAQFTNNPFDPRILKVFRDAADAWGAKKETKAVKRKIKNIPRMRKKTTGTERSPEVRRAKDKAAIGDLVSTASANPGNTRLTKQAGMAVIANMRASRG